MRSTSILIMLTIVLNIISANEAFEMDLAKVFRVKLDVDDHRGDTSNEGI
jgi:hypothetical protein